jgi:hypothetical protein
MIYGRAFLVWLVIMLAETLHGILRTLLLQPLIGDFTARQVTVFTGSAMILLIALLTIRWLGATTITQLIGAGLLWLVLTAGFEIVLGRLILNLSWERLAEDYNLLNGGLLPIGLIFLTLSPMLAAKLRRVL